MVVPSAHDFFGFKVMQSGEGLVGKFAYQVFCAIDFEWMECKVGVEIHFSRICNIFKCYFKINFYTYCK